MSLCYTVAGRSLLLYFKTVPFALFLSSGKSLVIMLLNLPPSIFSFWDCPCFHMILWVVFPSFPGHMSVHLRPSLIQEALILKLLTSIANTLSLIKVTFPDSGGTCLFEHYHSTNSDDPIWLFFCFFFFFNSRKLYWHHELYSCLLWIFNALEIYFWLLSKGKLFCAFCCSGCGRINSIPFKELE